MGPNLLNSLLWCHMSTMSFNPTATLLFVQQFVEVTIKENIKAHITCLLWGKSISHQWIPLTKGQLHGKRFHDMNHHGWSCQHWFRYWHSCKQIMSHYTNQCCLFAIGIAEIIFNELQINIQIFSTLRVYLNVLSALNVHFCSSFSMLKLLIPSSRELTHLY